MDILRNTATVEKLVERNERGKIVSRVEMYYTLEGAAYIHDVWTDENYQDMGYATSLMKQAIKRAEEQGCYKVFLVCAEEHVPFYEGCGMVKDQVRMIKRFSRYGKPVEEVI